MPTLTESYSDLETWTPTYERWRHGGWYVTNVRYPGGAVGCVHNNHVRKDGRWYIDNDHTYTSFPTRDAAARAERVAVAMLSNELLKQHA